MKAGRVDEQMWGIYADLMAKTTGGQGFAFDAAASASDNIQRFLDELEKRDSELGVLLRQNVSRVVPLPTEAGSRAAARSAFNTAIKKALDS